MILKCVAGDDFNCLLIFNSHGGQTMVRQLSNSGQTIVHFANQNMDVFLSGKK